MASLHGGIAVEHNLNSLLSSLSCSNKGKDCDSSSNQDVRRDLEILVRNLPQLALAAAIKEQVQQLLQQIAYVFSFIVAAVQENQDEEEQEQLCQTVQQAAVLLSCTHMWLEQNIEAIQECLLSLLPPLACLTDAALEYAFATLFSERLWLSLGPDLFKATADSIRGSVPVLCGVLGQLLVLCWQSIDSAVSNGSAESQADTDGHLKGCQTLFFALHTSLLKLGVRAQEGVLAATGPPEIRGMKNLNISWKALTEVMCRKLPDSAKVALVTEVQARQVVEKCITNLHTEIQMFLRSPKPDRTNVLLFWLGHLFKMVRSYGHHCVSPLSYKELLTAGIQVYAAMQASSHDHPRQLLASKVAPKVVEVMVMLLDNQGITRVPAAAGAAWVRANAGAIEDLLAMGCTWEGVPRPQADAQLGLATALLLKCSQLYRMGLGPATLKAASKQLVPYLLKASSVKAYEQGTICRNEAASEQGVVAEVQAACVAFMLVVGDAQVQPGPYESEAFGLAAQECTAQLYMCAASPHPFLSRLATQVLCVACSRCSPLAATQYLLALASVVADLTASQAVTECGSPPAQVGVTSAPECLAAVLSHVALASPPEACQQAFVQLGLNMVSASKLLGGVPDLAAVASLTMLWDAFSPAIRVAAAAADPASHAHSGQAPQQQQQQQQEVQERARQLLTSAMHVHTLLSSRALSSCHPCLLSYVAACLGWLLRALCGAIKLLQQQQQQPDGLLLAQACYLSADTCTLAFQQPQLQQPSAAGSTTSNTMASCPVPLSSFTLPALQLAAHLAPCFPSDALASLAGGPLAAALAHPACAPYATALVAHTARLDPVPIPLFHIALRTAFGEQGNGLGAGGALQHEALMALATAFRLLMHRDGSSGVTAALPHQLLLPGMMLDPSSPMATSLRAYIKDQTHPATVPDQAQAGAAWLLDSEDTSALNHLLWAQSPGPACTTGHEDACPHPHQQQQQWASTLQGQQQQLQGSAAMQGVTCSVDVLMVAAQDLATQLNLLGGASWTQPHPGGVSGLASEVGEQCAIVQRHLHGIMTVAQHLTAAAPASRAGNASAGLVAGLQGAILRLQADVAVLTANCKRLMGLVG